VVSRETSPEGEHGTAGNPVYIAQEAPPGSEYARVLDLITKTIMATYTVLTAWQVAKILCPPLGVKENLFWAWLGREFHRHTGRSAEPNVPPAWVREIYDDTRGGPSAN
jgi:hypothetical protein